jgi:inorganic pyrophosphatase
MKLFEKLSPIDAKSGRVHAIIDTPKGSRNKYAFDFDLETYKLKKVLPRGAVFPYDFGSIPGTVAPDGDPLDVLVIMDAPTFPGCLVEARLIGLIEAEQSADGKSERNDRLIAVAAESPTHKSIKSLKNIDPKLVEEIEHFFVSYNAARRTKFKPIGRKGPRAACALVAKNRNANRRYRN